MSLEQIDFLNNFVKYFGFSNIGDYETIIKTSVNETIITNVNNEMGQIKKLFKLTGLNLSRKKYIIDSPNLAICLLKNLLQQSNIPFDIVHKTDGNYLRLISPNKILLNYIDHRMTYINHDENEVVNFGEIELRTKRAHKKGLLALVLFEKNGYNSSSMKTNKIIDISFIENFENEMVINAIMPREYDLIKINNISVVQKIDDLIVYDDIKIDSFDTCIGSYKFKNDLIPFVSCQYAEIILKLTVSKKYISQIIDKKIMVEFDGIYLVQNLRNKMRQKLNIGNGVVSDGLFIGDEKRELSNEIIMVNNEWTLPRYDTIYDIELVTINKDNQIVDNEISQVNLFIANNDVYKLRNTNDTILKLNIEPIPMKELIYNNVVIKVNTFEKAVDKFIMVKYKYKESDVVVNSFLGHNISDGVLKYTT